MNWSFTASKIFSQCPRKWYYSKIMASPTTKDPLKREAYLLKQLQTIYAWRGSLVDTVITKLIVPKIKHHTLPSESEVIGYAMQLAAKQIEFGKSGKYRLPNMKKSSAGDAYCAFYDVEYNGNVDETKIQQAIEDIKNSLKNLLRSDFLKYIARHSSQIIAQRRLTFHFAGVRISSTPDLIVFFKNERPLIVDWKVHGFAYVEYRLQLGIYGIALSKVNPHKDFPNDTYNQLRDPTTIGSIEYQLLKNQLREYSFNTEDILDIEDYIFQSIMQINRAIDGKKYGRLDASQFQTARSPDICGRCQFKKLCWKNIPVQKGLFEVF